MKYMGSKNRIAKEILPIILKDRKLGQWYVEPFVGGANAIDKVSGNRIASDTNKYLIEMFKEVSFGWTPKDNYTEEQYRYIKNHKDENTMLTGYFAFALSYGGKFFGGWCRDKDNKRNYVVEAYKNSLKQFPKLLGVSFICCGYDKLLIPNNSIIYCDPPYQNTTGYRNKFNHNEFWQWCREKSNEGHSVFISEYNAPDDFKCVWSKEISSSLTKQTGSKKGIEKLFTL